MKKMWMSFKEWLKEKAWFNVKIKHFLHTPDNIEELVDNEEQKLIEEMEIKSYFTFAEMIASDTAKTKGIDNTPTSMGVEMDIENTIKFLNPLREAWGSAIRINSGYRCEALNKAVGGVSTSAHLTGNAVDLYPVNGKFEEFKVFILDYLKDKKFDQCIIEKSGNSQWIHLGIYNNDGKQRGETFSINK